MPGSSITVPGRQVLPIYLDNQGTLEEVTENYNTGVPGLFLHYAVYFFGNSFELKLSV